MKVNIFNMEGKKKCVKGSLVFYCRFDYKKVYVMLKELVFLFVNLFFLNMVKEEEVFEDKLK